MEIHIKSCKSQNDSISNKLYKCNIIAPWLATLTRLDTIADFFQAVVDEITSIIVHNNIIKGRQRKAS